MGLGFTRRAVTLPLSLGCCAALLLSGTPESWDENCCAVTAALSVVSHVPVSLKPTASAVQGRISSAGMQTRMLGCSLCPVFFILGETSFSQLGRTCLPLINLTVELDRTHWHPVF